MSEADNALQRVITKCWEDEAFKARLLADPAGVLAEEGVTVPDGVTVNVEVDAQDVHTLVIPAPPGRLADEHLDAVAAGAECSGKWGIDLSS